MGNMKKAGLGNYSGKKCKCKNIPQYYRKINTICYYINVLWLFLNKRCFGETYAIY